MRFVALALILLIVPALTAWLKQNKRHNHYAWFALGFLPFVVGAWNLDAAIISWAGWPGYAKGVIVSVVDAIALALVLSTRKPRVSVPFRYILLAYILSAFMSVAVSDSPQSSFFFVWQLLRMFVLFLAVAYVSADERAPPVLIAGLICGIVLQAGYAVSEKLSGVIQASGTLGHQNLLGMVTHFVLYPSLALLFASGRQKLPLIGVIAGLIVVAFGASRATIGLAGVGIILLTLLSLARQATSRKTKIAVLGIFALAIAAPVAISSLENRFEAKPVDGSNEEREAFERAAWMILADHPMGVGANQYVVVANTKGYSEKAGVIWNYSSRAANVHNAYLLIAAETGYFGLLCFIAFMTIPIFAALRFAWANRKDPRGDIALGFAVSLTIVCLHSFYEWVLVIYVVQYMLAISMGLIAGLVMQRLLEKRAANKGRHTKSEADEIRFVSTKA